MCGIDCKSHNIVLPTATVNLDLGSLNSLVDMISPRNTGFVSLFGTSIPIADLPGIDASVRISVATIASLISS